MAKRFSTLGRFPTTRLRRNRHGNRFYRWINEFPSLLLVAIVLLAVLKPV